jgi:putative ATP-dependent endonuclease of the OLD family
VFISEVRIENFRLFGAGAEAFVLELKPGLTALVGENDSGKTALIDAIRLVLGTTDQEYYRVDPADFYRFREEEMPFEEARNDSTSRIRE